MHHLASDDSKNVVVLINDYNPEFGVAIEKLSQRLNRPLKGVILLDVSVKERGINKPDTTGTFNTTICDFNDLKSLSTAINSFRNNLLVVSSSSERNQPYLKLVLPHVPYLLGPTEDSIDWATHKSTMRELLSSYDTSLSPKSELIHGDSDLDLQHILSDLSFPMIVKPNGLAASILVTRVDNEQELRAHLQHDFAVLQDIYTRDSGRGVPSIVIEEFMVGDMYSVDSYVNEDGDVWSLPPVKVTTAYSIGKEGFYSYQIDSATDLSSAEIKQLYSSAQKAVHAIGLRSCVAHIELFKTPSGWKIIELGPRAGGYRQDMYAASYGIDHAYNELLIKIGLEPQVSSELLAYSSVFNMYPEQEGIITEITGLEDAQRLSSVQRITTYQKPGSIALYCGNGGKFIIDGVLINQDSNKLKEDMQSLRDSVKIHTSPL